MSQKMIANLQDERAIAMADLEEAHIRSALEMQASHMSALELNSRECQNLDFVRLK